MRRSGSFDDGWSEHRPHTGGAADARIGRSSRPGRWRFVTDGTPGPIAGGVAAAPPRVRQMSAHSTVGGLPALVEPVRTRNDDTLTHDHVEPWPRRGRRRAHRAPSDAGWRHLAGSVGACSLAASCRPAPRMDGAIGHRRPGVVVAEFEGGSSLTTIGAGSRFSRPAYRDVVNNVSGNQR